MLKQIVIIDARKLEGNSIVDADICIVGAGVAGLTISQEFKDQNFSVCILESGGLGAEKDIQALCCGENIGLPYYPLDTARSRQFGGSSNRWLLEIGDNHIGARIRPLDPVDFEVRDWVPLSGWPFAKEHLDPYYERAQAICQSGPYNYDVKYWEKPDTEIQLPFKGDSIETVIFQFVSRDVFARYYLEDVKSMQSTTVFTHASALEIETDSSGNFVNHLRVGSLDGNEFKVHAKQYILAAGGIETPRLLLLSNRVHKEGVGNQHDMVGRCFMEHPHLWSGIIIPSDPSIFKRSSFYQIHNNHGVPVLGQLSVSNEVQRAEKILNYSAFIEAAPRPKPHASIRSSATQGKHIFIQLADALRRGDLNTFNRQLSTLFPVVNEFSIGVYRKFMKVVNKFSDRKRHEVFLLNHMTEQVPNLNSRVTLGHELDQLGQKRVQLDWQVTDLDMKSIIRAQELINKEFMHAGLGRIEIEQKDTSPPPDLHGGWHHMGTTRMQNDPKYGVVDENCRVHGISNLYIAGPSVFPTSGYANPVLTIMALAVRLADHIKQKYYA